MTVAPHAAARPAFAPVRVRTLTPDQVSLSLQAAWAELEARAIEPNAYLSPHFVLPAIRHLDPGARIFVTVVETVAAEVIGVGVFRGVPARPQFPVPHLKVYQSCHSFLGGLLIDRERAERAIDALFEHLHATRWRWHGIDLGDSWADGDLSQLIDAVIPQRGLASRDCSPRVRPVLAAEHRCGALAAKIKDREKQAKRRMRKLEAIGPVSWAAHRGGAVPPEAVESFLALEHCGWKGESGTSLRSNPSDERFFREVVAGFGSAGRALFTELKLDDQVVSSTSNFVSGGAGFAFKVGWRADLAKMSPGMLNELELMRAFQSGACRDLTFFDSGASEGSYLDELWTGRRPLASRMIGLSSIGRSALRAVSVARGVKRWLRPTGEASAGSNGASATGAPEQPLAD